MIHLNSERSVDESHSFVLEVVFSISASLLILMETYFVGLGLLHLRYFRRLCFQPTPFLAKVKVCLANFLTHIRSPLDYVLLIYTIGPRSSSTPANVALRLQLPSTKFADFAFSKMLGSISCAQRSTTATWSKDPRHYCPYISVNSFVST